ncbi:hypothetical protein BDZ91DRAFT_537152 [Kalaharituber pfeilii]|nr:hypothetical protein BDZ91DRAFT_537152 [Kalaharituber pfeilii]
MGDAYTYSVAVDILIVDIGGPRLAACIHNYPIPAPFLVSVIILSLSCSPLKRPGNSNQRLLSRGPLERKDNPLKTKSIARKRVNAVNMYQTKQYTSKEIAKGGYTGTAGVYGRDAGGASRWLHMFEPYIGDSRGDSGGGKRECLYVSF